MLVLVNTISVISKWGEPPITEAAFQFGCRVFGGWWPICGAPTAATEAGSVFLSHELPENEEQRLNYTFTRVSNNRVPHCEGLNSVENLIF